MCLFLILALTNKQCNKPEKYSKARTHYVTRPNITCDKTYVSTILGDRRQGKELDIDPNQTMASKGRTAMDAMRLSEVMAEKHLSDEQLKKMQMES